MVIGNCYDHTETVCAICMELGLGESNTWDTISVILGDLKMFKRVPISSSILFCFVLLVTTGHSREVPEPERPQERRPLHGIDYRHSDYALKAQKDLIIWCVSRKRPVEAEAALKRLLGDFNEHKNIAQAVNRIADEYLSRDTHSQAIGLFTYVTAKWPRSQGAMWAQTKLARVNIALGNDGAAQVAVDRLLGQYHKCRERAKAIAEIADDYCSSEKYGNARTLFEYISDNWPGTDYAMNSTAGIVRTSILLGDKAAAEAATDKLIADFSNSGDVADAVDELGDVYRDSKDYDSALRVYKRVVDTWPASGQAMESQGSIAKLNIRLGNEAAAQAAVDKLMTDFSGNKGAAEALQDIAGGYRDSKNYDEALRLSRHVVNTWPGSEQAVEAQMSVVELHVLLADDTNADAAIDKLIADVSAGNGDVADAIDAVADRCRSSKKYAKALQLYERVVNTWPASKHAMGAQASIAELNVEVGSEATAEAAIEKLFTDFSSHENIADIVDGIADTYRDSEKYDKALQLYQRVANTWPATEQALGSQASVAMLSMQLGNEAAAKGAVDKLIQDHSARAELRETLVRIADKYEKLGKTEQANGVHERIGQLYAAGSDSDAVDTIATGPSIALVIESEQDGLVQATIDHLVAMLAKDRGLSSLLYNIAKRYGEIGEYDKAAAIYEKIAEYSRGSYEKRAPLNIAKDRILSGIDAKSDSDVSTAVDKLITDFSGHEYLPVAVFLVAENCYARGCFLEKQNVGDKGSRQFQMAAGIWEKVAERFPDSDIIPQALNRAGECHKKLGEYGRSIDCYQNVFTLCAQKGADDYPDYDLGWNALFLVGRNYEELKELGIVAESQADTLITAAYEHLVERYPDCMAAGIARRWLSRHKSR